MPKEGTPSQHPSSGQPRDVTTTSSTYCSNTAQTRCLLTTKDSTSSTPLPLMATSISSCCSYTKTSRSIFQMRKRIRRSCGRHTRGIHLVWICSYAGAQMSMRQMTRVSQPCTGLLYRVRKARYRNSSSTAPTALLRTMTGKHQP